MRITASPFIPGIGYGRIRYWWESEQNLNNVVIVIRDPSINKILSIKGKSPSAIVILGGHRFSHILMYLYTLGIPAVLLDNETTLEEGSWVLVDGETGHIELSKSANPSNSWAQRCLNHDNSKTSTNLVENGIVKTKDGIELFIEASVNNAEGAIKALDLGVSKIGVTRSEFCFQNQQEPPAEEEHKTVINNILSASDSCDVSIRLLDLGGGKVFDWTPDVPSLKDSLGVRGGRALRHPELRSLLVTQLEAIKAIEDNGRLHILVPFISNYNEFLEIKQDIIEIVGADKHIGAMLETPSSAMAAAEIAQISDNITIGTNDLMQCFFGASREVSAVGDLLVPYSPSLYRFFQYIAKLQGKIEKPFRICGHLPLLPFSFEILVGLGFKCFSVEPSYIRLIAKRASEMSYSSMNKICTVLMEKSTPEEVIEFIKNEMK